MGAPANEVRTGSRRPGLTRALKTILGAAPLLGALACLPLGTPVDLRQGLLAVALGALYIVAFRNEFLSSRGSSVPTEPVLVAMALVLPTPWVLPVGLVAVVVASIGLDVVATGPVQWLLASCRSAWNITFFCCALMLVHRLAPGWPTAAAIACAVTAQIALDGAQVLAVEALEGDPRQVLRPLAWTYAIDVLLGFVGYCIVTTVGTALPWVVLVITPVLLMRLLAHDRATYFRQASDLTSAVDEATEEARRDPMTGLLNRRGWEEVLEQTERHLHTASTPTTATVLVADLDRLKLTNDTYGHLAGDSLICGFAELLVESLPQDAAVARLGGDEFAVVLTGPTAQEPPDLLSLVRERVLAAAPIGPVRVSASLGQTTYPPGPDLASAVEAADHAARVDKEMRRMTRDDLTARSA